MEKGSRLRKAKVSEGKVACKFHPVFSHVVETKGSKTGEAVSNGHKNFQLLAKFDLCSICSQNLDECSLARVRKIFAIACMLLFSLKFARFIKIP